MNDVLQTAKDLIAKGIKLGDMELVKMGSDLLGTGPSGEVIIPENLQEISDSHLQNVSEDDILKEDTSEPTRDPYDFSFQISDRNDSGNKGARIRDDGTTLTRSEPINLDRIQNMPNLFEDDLTLEADANTRIEEKKLYRKPRVTRTRTQPNLIDINCDECGNSFSVHPIHCRRVKDKRRYVCDKCIRGRGRPER